MPFYFIVTHYVRSVRDRVRDFAEPKMEDSHSNEVIDNPKEPNSERGRESSSCSHEISLSPLNGQWSLGQNREQSWLPGRGSLDSFETASSSIIVIIAGKSRIGKSWCKRRHTRSGRTSDAGEFAIGRTNLLLHGSSKTPGALYCRECTNCYHARSSFRYDHRCPLEEHATWFLQEVQWALARRSRDEDSFSMSYEKSRLKRIIYFGEKQSKLLERSQDVTRRRLRGWLAMILKQWSSNLLWVIIIHPLGWGRRLKLLWPDNHDLRMAVPQFIDDCACQVRGG